MEFLPWCDNTRACHNPTVLGEDSNAARVMCRECKETQVLRKDWREVFENRAYSRFYRRDSIQPNTDLFYKYYPDYIRT